MIWSQVAVIYLHYISVFTMIGAVITELILLKRSMSYSSILNSAKADLIFGVSAIGTLLTGGLRFFYFGKGVSYYLDNPVFLIKISLFTCVGLISIYPTIKFFTIKKQANNHHLQYDIPNYQILKAIVIIELLLLLINPILAIIVAKGII